MRFGERYSLVKRSQPDMPRAHKKLQRLFVSDELSTGGEIVLTGKQAHYLINVLRSRVGGELILFNGRHGAWLATIIGLKRRALVLRLAEQVSPQPDLPDLWYGFAPLKTARLDYMVQKATEMGVGALQPVITRFTQGKTLKTERLNANIVEAAEQCEILSLPRVLAQVDLVTLVENWDFEQPGRTLIFADEAQDPASPLAQIGALQNTPVGLLIGPEGGFSEVEREMLLDCSFVCPISLGPRILRADTAAVAALAIIQSKIGDWPLHR